MIAKMSLSERRRKDRLLTRFGPRSVPVAVGPWQAEQSLAYVCSGDCADTRKVANKNTELLNMCKWRQDP